MKKIAANIELIVKKIIYTFIGIDTSDKDLGVLKSKCRKYRASCTKRWMYLIHNNSQNDNFF